MQSTTTGTAIAVETTTGAKFLVIKVEMSCGFCGDQSVQFCGRHARALRDWLIDVIDQHPELCGRDQDVTRISTVTVEGPGPTRPENN